MTIRELGGLCGKGLCGGGTGEGMGWWRDRDRDRVWRRLVYTYIYTYLDVSDGGVLPSGELEEEDGQEVAAADGSTAELESRPEVDEEDVGRNEGGTAWTIDGRGGGEMGMRTTGEGRVGSEEEGEGEGG